jgi:hypothetical protein
MLREGRDHIDHLVLGDSTLVLDYGDRATAVTDNRIHRVITRTRRAAVTGSEPSRSGDTAPLQAIRRRNRRHLPHARRHHVPREKPGLKYGRR